MNSELFDCFTGRILGELYESFPVKKVLDIRSFDTEPCVEFYKTSPHDMEEILKGTIEFLEENELITFDRSKNGWQGGFFSGATLSLKGLQLLKKAPKSIEKDYESIGDKLIKAVKEQGIHRASTIVNEKLWGLLS
ncbi:hypothetical protein [Sulfurimonas sp.]|nr:hypothetical protein [Sulfurimonas sp.]